MSALQKKLVLCFALVLALQACLNLVLYFTEVRGGNFGGDFVGFWNAAQHARSGDIPAIYDAGKWQAFLSSGADGLGTWFVYPPFALFGLWPLGAMTYNDAILAWSLAPLPFYFGLLYLLARRSLQAQMADAPARAFFVLVFAAALPFLSANLFTGQTGAFVAVFLFGAAYFWNSRPAFAGICIGLLAIKPQMGLLLPFALFAACNFRAIISAAATIVIACAAATAWLGAGIWTDYLHMTEVFGRFIGRGHGGIRQLVVGPYVSFQAVGLPALLAGILQALITLTLLGVIVYIFLRWKVSRSERNSDDGRMDLRLGLLAAGMLLATPYSLSYDTPLLMLAVVPLLARIWCKGWMGMELAAFACLMVLPFAQPLLLKSHVPFGFLAVSLSFWVLLRWYRHEPAKPAR
jgi:hypothetical protein